MMKRSVHEICLLGVNESIGEYYKSNARKILGVYLKSNVSTRHGESYPIDQDYVHVYVYITEMCHL